MQVAKPKGRKNSSKFLYWAEIGQAYEAEHSLLIYQHFTHENREAFTSRLTQRLQTVTAAEAVWAIHTPHVLFLLVSSDPKIIERAECLPARSGMRVERS